MKELVGSVVFVLVLTLNANAQIQQTTHDSDVCAKCLCHHGRDLFRIE